MKNTCLEIEDEKITLKKNYIYYYQVQMQMFVANLQYCDCDLVSPNFFEKKLEFCQLSNFGKG